MIFIPINSSLWQPCVSNEVIPLGQCLHTGARLHGSGGELYVRTWPGCLISLLMEVLRELLPKAPLVKLGTSDISNLRKRIYDMQKIFIICPGD